MKSFEEWTQDISNRQNSSHEENRGSSKIVICEVCEVPIKDGESRYLYADADNIVRITCFTHLCRRTLEKRMKGELMRRHYNQPSASAIYERANVCWRKK